MLIVPGTGKIVEPTKVKREGWTPGWGAETNHAGQLVSGNQKVSFQVGNTRYHGIYRQELTGELKKMLAQRAPGASDIRLAPVEAGSNPEHAAHGYLVQIDGQAPFVWVPNSRDLSAFPGHVTPRAQLAHLDVSKTTSPGDLYDDVRNYVYGLNSANTVTASRLKRIAATSWNQYWRAIIAGGENKGSVEIVVLQGPVGGDVATQRVFVRSPDDHHYIEVDMNGPGRQLADWVRNTHPPQEGKWVLEIPNDSRLTAAKANQAPATDSSDGLGWVPAVFESGHGGGWAHADAGDGGYCGAGDGGGGDGGGGGGDGGGGDGGC